MNLLIIAFLVLIGGASKFYKRFVPISIGLELKTFFTILIAYYNDPYTALLCAIFMVIISAAVSGRFCHWMGIKIGVYAGVCLIIGVFHSFGIGVAGKIAVVFLNVAYVLFNALFKDFKIYSDLPGNIINVAFNFVLLGLVD
ncbi:MAG: hypothetical protein V1859_02620 [archaeon]